MGQRTKSYSPRSLRWLTTKWALQDAFRGEGGSLTVDQTWIYRFHNTLNLTYQQQGSLLEKTIAEDMVHRNVGAAIDTHERLGNVIANDVVVPFGQTQILNPPHSRRAVYLLSSDAAVLVSDEHTLRSMTNPTNAYTKTMAYALGRRADKHLIDAALGSAMTGAVTTGSGIITFGTQALPSAQKVGSAAAIDLALIISVAEKMSKASVPNGANERKFAYSPGQLRNLMAITQASSSDFTKNRIHDTGTINGVSWEGFDWIEIADVVREDASTVLQRMLPLVSTTRSCLAFHRGAIGLSIGRPIGPPVIGIRHDLNDSIQIRQVMMMNAVRVWEGGVVQVNCLEN